ncbi:MAG TPA: heme ABC exporter ATP-binding protein CcmA [Acidimicrobiales bacterium]|nr:heme ABC exporter ATP-binding protein CcmA [Acidimicrobiales bacterium]
MDPVVSLRGAVALAGRFPALAGVELSVSAGEVVSVVGPNGAGKTTLLRVLAGLAPLSAGHASVLGVDLRVDAAAVRRRVGFLGHAPALYDELTAAENVRFALAAAGAPRHDAAAALERVGITGRLAKTEAGRLSAGQRRRVALAAVLGRRPELWLLDEPHAGLDATARSFLGELVGEAVGAGASVLFSSHEPELAGALSDRRVSMAGGRVADVTLGKRRAKLSSVLDGGTHVA